MTAANELTSLKIRELTIEVAVMGRWISVPALALGARYTFLKGGWLKVAAVHQEDWTPGEIERPDLWIKVLKKCPIGGRLADVFTFAQKLPNANPKYAYQIEWSSSAVVRIRSFKDWWETLPQETRKNVRRAQKRGLIASVRELDDDLVRGIMNINDESPTVQGRRSRHYGKNFEQVWKDQLDYLERSAFVCAHDGAEMVGFMKLVRCGDFASILTTLTKRSHQGKRPANALIARAIQFCEDEGIRYLVYGLLNYGNKRDGSLREFKLRNGFNEVLIPRYYVPLTARGKIALRLGLHRGLIGILPSPAVRLAVGLRTRFYAFKQSFRAGVAQW